MLIQSNQTPNNDIEVVPEDVLIRVEQTDGIAFPLEFPTPLDIDEIDECGIVRRSSTTLAKPFELLGRFVIENELLSLSLKDDKYKNTPSYNSRLASLNELNDNIELATEIRKDALTRFESSLIKHQLVDGLVKSEKYDAAKEILHSLTINGDVEAFLKVAILEANNQHLDTAQELVESALNLDPIHSGANLFSGVILLLTNRYQEAIRHFKVAIDTGRLSSTVLVNMALAYWRLNETRQTLRSLRRALSVNPYDINAAHFFSDVAYKMNLHDEVIITLEKIIEKDQTKPTIYSRLARAYFFKGVGSGNKSFFEKALESLKNEDSLGSSSGTFNNIGLCYNEMGQHSKGIRFLNLAFSSHTNVEDKSRTLKNIITASNAINECKSSYKITHSFLNSIDGYNSLSVEWLKISFVKLTAKLFNEDKALSYLEDIQPRLTYARPKVDALSMLIYQYTIRQSVENIQSLAVQLYNAIEETDSSNKNSNFHALNNLAFAYYSLDKIVDGDSVMSKIQSLVNHSPYITATFGMSHLRKGNLDKGEMYYNKAISLIPQYENKQYFKQRMQIELAAYYLKKCDFKKAEKLLIKANKITNGIDLANNQIKQLLLSMK